MLVAAGLFVQNQLNNWFFRAYGGEQRPALFDVGETVPELLALDRAFPEIRQEAMELLGWRENIPTTQETDGSQACAAHATPYDWRIFWLEVAGEKAEPNRARCPKTAALLDSIPNVFAAGFSILDPGKCVSPHRGPYGGYLRYHLGLIVPKDNPPKIRVRDEFHTWQEGRSVLFDDSLEHEVINSSTEPRVVLIVDVARPMRGAQKLANQVALRLARPMWGKPIVRRALDLAGSGAKTG